MACKEHPDSGREGAFKNLLITLSQNLSPSNVSELMFAADLSYPEQPFAIDLLRKMCERGIFSPYCSEPLLGLLQQINRHDLGEHVNHYVNQYPDANPSSIEGRFLLYSL